MTPGPAGRPLTAARLADRTRPRGIPSDPRSKRVQFRSYTRPPSSQSRRRRRTLELRDEQFTEIERPRGPCSIRTNFRAIFHACCSRRVCASALESNWIEPSARNRMPSHSQRPRDRRNARQPRRIDLAGQNTLNRRLRNAAQFREDGVRDPQFPPPQVELVKSWRDAAHTAHSLPVNNDLGTIPASQSVDTLIGIIRHSTTISKRFYGVQGRHAAWKRFGRCPIPFARRGWTRGRLAVHTGRFEGGLNVPHREVAGLVARPLVLCPQRGSRRPAREAPFPRIHGAMQPYDPVQARALRAGLPGGPRLSSVRLGHGRRHELLRPGSRQHEMGSIGARSTAIGRPAATRPTSASCSTTSPRRIGRTFPGTPAPMAGRSRRRSALPQNRILSPPSRSATSPESTTTNPTALSLRTWPAACARAIRN